MDDLIKEFLQQKRFAVVGSFRNKEKIAYKIFKNLIAKGYEVYPVNPNVKQVDGIKCYVSIRDLPVVVDVVSIVTPPEISFEIVKQCLEKGIRRVWLQPGAESKEILDFCNKNNIKVVYNSCIMLVKNI